MAPAAQGHVAWLDRRADVAAIQVRHRLLRDGEALVEYRALSVRDGGNCKGFLLGVGCKFPATIRIGVGDNGIDASDDRTRPGYEHRGGFLDNTGDD